MATDRWRPAPGSSCGISDSYVSATSDMKLYVFTPQSAMVHPWWPTARARSPRTAFCVASERLSPNPPDLCLQVYPEKYPFLRQTPHSAEFFGRKVGGYCPPQTASASEGYFSREIVAKFERSAISAIDLNGSEWMVWFGCLRKKRRICGVPLSSSISEWLYPS